jgi:subtilisin family serine protease
MPRLPFCSARNGTKVTYAQLRTIVTAPRFADAQYSEAPLQRSGFTRCVIFFSLQSAPSNPAFRTLRLLWFLRKIVVLIALIFTGILLAFGLRLHAQQLPSPIGAAVPHRYLVAYRDGSVPSNAQARIHANFAAASVRVVGNNPFGIAVLDTSASTAADEAATIATIAADPNVEFVIHDRVLSAHSLILRPVLSAITGIATGTTTQGSAPTQSTIPPYDTYYASSPQNWDVLQAGGYGAGVSGGPAHGPWNTTMGAGVRIAILDSGVDANHPDIAPNLALNLSEIDQSAATGMPSACDDGSPQDQQGHGTWTASLAAAAIGPGTGQLIGVAPAATILNIKVLERMPDTSSTSTNVTTQCETGEASGLLSWVIQGIQDAIDQHADIISLSLGTLVDLTTGEGAGIQATFDRVTYAADQAGAIVIASAGNDGVNLADPRYIEVPAQSRSVLAVVASTNPACAQDLTPGSTCAPGPIALPYYSNYGAPLNAIAAPGGSYPDGPDTGVSGWVRGACSNGLPNTTDGAPGDSAHSLGCFNLGHTQYVQAMGTSASAPLVAGAAALIRAANPSWTPDQVVAALRSSATTTASLSAAPLLNTEALLP